MPFSLSDLEIQPKQGELLPLKTKGEVRSSLEIVDVFVLPVSARFANPLLRILGEQIPGIRTVDLQHLRRVVSKEYLPTSSFSSITKAESCGTDARYLLVCPTSLIESSRLALLLEEHAPFSNLGHEINLHIVTVPALPPTSAEQAEDWSNRYWPTIYKNTNPYGPHPSVVARHSAEVASVAGKCLSLAEKVAEETFMSGLGIESGCVIVHQQTQTTGNASIIAVAGDARWVDVSRPDENVACGGNAAAHATLRAIGMVAMKRLSTARASRAVDSPTSAPTANSAVDDALVVPPRTPIEICTFVLSDIDANGYLCTDLDIYLTHEPCVMCSMAILHSRFRRCVIGKRVVTTGGLTSDSGLQHGIFWRPTELNWKMLAWEWVGMAAGLSNASVGKKISF